MVKALYGLWWSWAAASSAEPIFTVCNIKQYVTVSHTVTVLSRTHIHSMSCNSSGSDTCTSAYRVACSLTEAVACT